MRTRFVRRAALAAAVVLPSLALAWGEAGHKVVGEIAYKRLSTNARSEIDQLLAIEQTNLPDCAFWPDAVAPTWEPSRDS